MNYAQAVAIDRQPLCRCGSRTFDCRLVQFPMTWEAECVKCHNTIEAHLKPTPGRGEWVNGAFDKNDRWVPGHFK